jgi:D-proline reductase (dithiol) PrdB
MSTFRRLKNRLLAKAITRYPSLASRFTASYKPWEAEDIPWTPIEKPLSELTVALVTTAGVHHRDQPPFDMADPDGDPTFRELDDARPLESLMITHDYYDHSAADRDLNVVYPMERLRELRDEGAMGGIAPRHYGFMGHITGRHLPTLIERTGPEVARRLLRDGVGAVVLTPG